MIESGYYPPGAEFDPNAPYNQVELPKREFEVTISQTLSKPVTVFTNDYNLEIDCDEDGKYEALDTSDTAWKDVYEDEYHTPAQLIQMLKLVNGQVVHLNIKFQILLLHLIQKQIVN